jgi:hypothetical protein
MLICFEKFRYVQSIHNSASGNIGKLNDEHEILYSGQYIPF